MQDTCSTDADADPWPILLDSSLGHVLTFSCSEPQFAKAVKLQAKMTASSSKSAKSTRSISPTLTTKIDILSPSFDLGAEHFSKEAAQSSSVAYPSRDFYDYPPNSKPQHACFAIHGIEF